MTLKVSLPENWKMSMFWRLGKTSIGILIVDEIMDGNSSLKSI
jgi:hypothetical protein